MGKNKTRSLLLALAFLLMPIQGQTGGDVATEFTNRGGIVNTRHNLSQLGEDESIDGGVNSTKMDEYRIQYGEVCIYCHTPHGANRTTDAPLWNRTVRSDITYQTYDSLGTSSLSSDITAPGANSRACLTCHDGTTAIDSIINQPGTGYYNSQQEGTQDNAWLDIWATDQGVELSSHQVLGVDFQEFETKLTATEWYDAGNCTNCTVPVFNAAYDAYVLAVDTTNEAIQDQIDTSCMTCHLNEGAGSSNLEATDFSSFVIGTKLTNDHPVGIQYPEERTPDGAAGSNYDFNALPDDGVSGKLAWYDSTPVAGSTAVGNGRMDKGEIRFYDGGDGLEVECASCHDPHGVPSAGPGSVFNPTFLRTSNAGSALCQTCHAK